MHLPLKVTGVAYTRMGLRETAVGGWTIHDSAMNYVAVVLEDEGTPGRDLLDVKAEAEYIVKAVNAHDELVQALRECVERLDLLVYRDRHKLLDVSARQHAKALLARLES